MQKWVIPKGKPTNKSDEKPKNKSSHVKNRKNWPLAKLRQKFWYFLRNFNFFI